MSPVERIGVKGMADLLQMRKTINSPTVLLLGTRAGGLFRSEQFYKTLQQFSKRDFNTLPHTEQFSECYRILTERHFSEIEIYNILRTALQNLSITKSDACLAEIIKQDHFDEIISTNMDDFLEQALTQADMKEQSDFEIYIPGHGVLQHEKSMPCRITKVFGELASRTHITSKRLAHLDNNQELKTFLHSILAKDILIVGIDPVWDEVILRALPGKAGTLWFVNDEDLIDHSQLSHILQERQARCVVGREGSYDKFLQTLHTYLYGGVPFNYQLAIDILNNLQVLRDEQQILLEEIKKLQREVSNLSHPPENGG